MLTKFVAGLLAYEAVGYALWALTAMLMDEALQRFMAPVATIAIIGGKVSYAVLLAALVYLIARLVAALILMALPWVIGITGAATFLSLLRDALRLRHAR